VHGTDKALAITTDCTPRYCYADPYEGGKQAIAEAYRNLSAVGATPLAVTNCLNFGNPQRPEIMAQFVGCLEGMADACRALDFPIVSGNVSLYNESKATGGGSAILPTPAIGAVGLLKDWRKAVGIGFRQVGDFVLLLGGDTPQFNQSGHLGQSIWAREIQGLDTDNAGSAPFVDLQHELRLGTMVRELIELGWVTAVHDVSDGGILVALTEMSLAGNLGVHWDFQHSDPTPQSLFGEDQGRYIVTVPGVVYVGKVIGYAEARGFPCEGWFAQVSGDSIRITCEGDVDQANILLATLRAAHEGFFPALMGKAG
jgi:phosphoribosylformylglycinamidine synthase subunit PurL